MNFYNPNNKQTSKQKRMSILCQKIKQMEGLNKNNKIKYNAIKKARRKSRRRRISKQWLRAPPKFEEKYNIDILNEHSELFFMRDRHLDRT